MNLPSAADQPIRRHADGSIDIDHYAKMASADRQEAIRRAFGLLARGVRRLVGASRRSI